jgi:hypothetical protein
MVGACDRERSQGEVSLWDETPGWEVLFSMGHRMSHRVGHRLAPREDVMFGHPKD